MLSKLQKGVPGKAIYYFAFVAAPVIAVMSLLTGSAAERQISEFWGPFKAVPSHLEECPEELRPRRKFYDASARVFRDRQNVEVWHLTGNATSYIVMGCILDSWVSNGGWKMNFYRMHMPKVFTFWRTGWPTVWAKIMTAASMPPDHGPTFPPGNYSIKDINSDFDVHYPSKLIYGKFRMTSQMKNSVTGEVVACGRAFFSFVPKRPKTVAVHSRPKVVSKVVNDSLL